MESDVKFNKSKSSAWFRERVINLGHYMLIEMKYPQAANIIKTSYHLHVVF